MVASISTLGGQLAFLKIHFLPLLQTVHSADNTMICASYQLCGLSRVAQC